MNKTHNRTYLLTLVMVILVNLFLSTHFLTLFLIGVVFKIFLEVIEKEEYYFLIAVIATFLFIEVTQGFYLFSLILISIVIYYFVLTRIKHLFSSSILSEFVYILLFYIAVFVIHNIKHNIQLDQILLFIYNFLIDSIIIGLFL
jgi:hypothetical protein